MIAIAKKCVKVFLGSVIILPLLAGIPLLQIYVIGNMIGNVDSQSGSYELVDIVFLGGGSGTFGLETFAASCLVMSIMMAAIVAAATMIGEREEGTAIRIAVSPLKKTKVLCGNVLGYGLSIFVIPVLVVAISGLFMQIDWGNSWLALLLLTLVVIYVVLAITFFIASLFSNAKLATGIMSFAMIVMTFLSGGLTMKEPIAGLGKFTMNKWAFDAYTMLMNGSGLARVAPNALVLLAIGTIFGFLASAVNRRENAYE